MDPNQIEQQYSEAIRQAEHAANDAAGRFNTAVAFFNSTQPTIGGGDITSPLQPNPAYAAAQRQLEELERTLRESRNKVADLHAQKAKALADLKPTSPEEQARLQALTNQANASAEQSRAQAATEAAQAELYRAQASQVGATNDVQRQQAQAAVTNAQANLQSASASLQNANANMLQAQSQASIAPSQIAKNEAEAAATRSGISLTSEQAGQAKAQADKLRQETADLKRRAELLPTDDQNRRAIEAEIATKEKQVAEITSRITASDAGITRGQLDNRGLYGYQERVKEIARLLEAGAITDADAATKELEEGLRNNMAGTSTYEAFTDDRSALQAGQDKQITQRNQNVDLVKTRTTAFSGLAGNALGDTLTAARYGTPGSDAGAAGYAGLLGNFLQLMGGPQGFQQPAQVNTDVPLWAQRPGPQPTAAPSASPGPGSSSSASSAPAPGPPTNPDPLAGVQRVLGADIIREPLPPPWGGAPMETAAQSQARNAPAVPDAFVGGATDGAYLEKLRRDRLAIVNGANRRAA